MASAVTQNAVANGAASAGQHSRFYKYMVILAVMPTATMEILDSTVVNVSLPHIGGSLGSSVNEATWVITAYLIANAIIVPMGGWLSHRFGRRKLMLNSVVCFTVSSVLCGLAPNLPLLVLFRIIQGLTGGGLQPLCQSVLLEEWADDRQKAMRFWAIGVVLAPIFGPTLGGWLTDTWTWRLVFFINVPVGLLSFLLISKFIRDPEYLRDGKAAKIDGAGIVLLALGMGAMQFVFDKGEQEDWSSTIVAIAVAAVVLVFFFVLRESRAKSPFVKVHLFKDWNFGFGSVIGFLLYLTLFGSVILVPLFMETVLGWSAIATGLWTGPRGLGALVGILLQWVPRTQKVLSSRWIASVGFAATGLVFLFGFAGVFGYGGMDMNTGPWQLFWPQLIQGFAITVVFMPIVPAVMAYIKPADMPYASSLWGSIRNIGSSAGVSFVAILLDHKNQVHQAALSANVVARNPATVSEISGLKNFFMIHGMNAHAAGQQALAVLYRELLAQANLLSFLDLFRICGVILIGVSIGPLLFKPKPANAPAQVILEE